MNLYGYLALTKVKSGSPMGVNYSERIRQPFMTNLPPQLSERPTISQLLNQARNHHSIPSFQESAPVLDNAATSSLESTIPDAIGAMIAEQGIGAYLDNLKEFGFRMMREDGDKGLEVLFRNVNINHPSFLFLPDGVHQVHTDTGEPLTSWDSVGGFHDYLFKAHFTFDHTGKSLEFASAYLGMDTEVASVPEKSEIPDDNIRIFCAAGSNPMGNLFMVMNRLLVYGINQDTWEIRTTTDTQQAVLLKAGDYQGFINILTDVMLHGELKPADNPDDEKRMQMYGRIEELFHSAIREHVHIQEQQDKSDLESLYFADFDHEPPFMPEPIDYDENDRINHALALAAEEDFYEHYGDFPDFPPLDHADDLNYNDKPAPTPRKSMTEQERLEDLNIHTEAFFRALFFSRSPRMCPKSLSYEDGQGCSDVMRVVLETKTGKQIDLFVSGYGGTCLDNRGFPRSHSNFSDLIQTILRLQDVNMTDGLFATIRGLYEECYEEYRKQFEILNKSQDFAQNELKAAFKEKREGFSLESVFSLLKQKGFADYQSVMGIEAVSFNETKQRDEYTLFGYPIRFSQNRFVINSDLIDFKNDMNRQEGLNALLETVQHASGRDIVGLRTSWKHFIEKVVLPYYVEFLPKNLEKNLPQGVVQTHEESHYHPNGSLAQIVLPLAEPEDEGDRDDLTGAENWQDEVQALLDQQKENIPNTPKEDEMKTYEHGERLSIVDVPPYEPPPDPKVVVPALMMPLDDWEEANIAENDKKAWQAYRSNHYSPDNEVVIAALTELAQMRFKQILDKMEITNTEIFHRFAANSMLEVLQSKRLLSLIAHPERDDVILINSTKMGFHEVAIRSSALDGLKNGMELLNLFGKHGFNHHSPNYQTVKSEFERVLKENALEQCFRRIMADMDEYHRLQTEHLKALEMPQVDNAPEAVEPPQPTETPKQTGGMRPKSDAAVIPVPEAAGFPQSLPPFYLADDAASEFYRRMKADPESAKGELRPYLYSSKVRMNSQCELSPSFMDFIHEVNALLKNKGKSPIVSQTDFEKGSKWADDDNRNFVFTLENGRAVFSVSQRHANGSYSEHWQLESGSCRYMDNKGDSLSRFVRALLYETGKSQFISDAELNFCASRALISVFLQRYPLTAVLDDLSVSAKMAGGRNRVYEMADGARFSYTQTSSGELATAFNRGQASAFNSIRLMQIFLAWENGLPADKDSLNGNKNITGYHLGKARLLEHHLSLNPQRQQMVFNDFGGVGEFREKGFDAENPEDKQQKLSDNLPERSPNQNLMMAYLAKRNIPPEVIASNLNSMYQGRYKRPGKTGEVVVFMTDSSAAVRGCTPETEHVKETVMGSVLDKPYAMNPCSKYWKNTGTPVHRIAVVEAGIDCLSYLTCFPLDHVHALFGLNMTHMLKALKELPEVAPMDGRVQLVYACDNTRLDENAQAYDEGSRNSYFDLMRNMAKHCYGKFIQETENQDYRFDRADNFLRHLVPFIKDRYPNDADDIMTEVRKNLADVGNETDFEQLLGRVLFETEYVKTGAFAVRTPYHPEYGMFKDWNDMLCNIVSIEQERHPDKDANEILADIQKHFSPECEMTKHHSLYCEPPPTAVPSPKP